MTLKHLGVAFALGAIAAVTSFAATMPVLTAWVAHYAQGDGQSGLGVIAGSLYVAFFFGAITIGIALARSRRRP